MSAWCFGHRWQPARQPNVANASGVLTPGIIDLIVLRLGLTPIDIQRSIHHGTYHEPVSEIHRLFGPSSERSL